MRAVIFGVLLGVAVTASVIGGLALYLESSSNDEAGTPTQIAADLDEVFPPLANEREKLIAFKNFRKRADVKALEETDRLFRLEMQVQQLELQYKSDQTAAQRRFIP